MECKLAKIESVYETEEHEGGAPFLSASRSRTRSRSHQADFYNFYQLSWASSSLDSDVGVVSSLNNHLLFFEGDVNQFS